MQEAEKLQKTATAALVVAEKAKIDQINLKKEYEAMLKDLKATIIDIKKEAIRNLNITPSPGQKQKKYPGREGDDESEEINGEIFDDDELDDNDDENKYKNLKKINKQQQKEIPRGSSSKLSEVKYESSSKSGGYGSFFSRPSSIISGLTSIGRSSASIDGEKDKGEKNKIMKNDTKLTEKKTKKEKISKPIKYTRQLSDDFPMIDDTISPRTVSPVDPDSPDIESLKENINFDLGKSTSSPSVPQRPKALNLVPGKSELLYNKGNSLASSPDSPTRVSSPFDVPKFQLNGRATSPTGFPLHRPGSTPGPLNRQGSMTTVPEDRAVDLRTFETRPSDPPPPPPTHKIFAISRQNSTPNIATQKSNNQAGLQRQHSLGVVLEESKTVSRQGSLLSMPDERLIVDKTLPLSPTPSMMSFPGSWSTTSLNQPESLCGTNRAVSPLSGSPMIRPRNALEMVAGGVIAGSSLSSGKICAFDEKDDIGPLATSSLKKRKKVKKDPIEV